MEDTPRTVKRRRPHPARRARRITAAASAAAFVAMGAGMAHSAALPKADDETSVAPAATSDTSWAATTSATTTSATTTAAHTQTQGS
jgi:hypothetical protein